MNKEQYIELVNKDIPDKSKDIILEQIERFYKVKQLTITQRTYKIGEDVFLKKGTLLHGTYKNLEGLKEIINNGLLAGLIIEGRLSKYPGCVGVWNLKQDYYLKDYINFYSGGTIGFKDSNGNNKETKVIPFDELNNIKEEILKHKSQRWLLEQTKEARFMPSLSFDDVQIGMIFDGDMAKELLKGDILNNYQDDILEPFVNPYYYEKFIKDRHNKDDFFTDRESAILFGLPANLIEGILVGRNYEQDENILKEIKKLLPDAYICNLDGKVIY